MIYALILTVFIGHARLAIKLDTYVNEDDCALIAEYYRENARTAVTVSFSCETRLLI